MRSMASLLSTFPHAGRVDWIGIRPARRAPVEPLQHVETIMSGLLGDRRTAPGKRAVTLIQSEHFPVIASLTSHDTIDPALLRRNIAVSGINLLALKGQHFTIGNVVLQGTGICAPCSRMEDLLGDGGYNAMRGHGGITAEVVECGHIAVGDHVNAILRD